MEVTLPGGLLRGTDLERRATLCELTGRAEQSLLDANDDAGRVAFVNRVLCCVVQDIGGRPVDEQQIAALCMADRHTLMLRLAAQLAGERMWLKVTCAGCEQAFDVEVNRNELPVKPAGQGYPRVEVQLGSARVRLRVPSAADQQAIEGLDDEDAVALLIERCTESVDGEPAPEGFATGLDARQIDIIDRALDAVAPAVCTELLVACPECRTEQRVLLDHYQLAELDERGLYDEVHSLASHYHWSEADILALPLTRRRRYLELIARAPAYADGAPPA